MSDTFYRDFEDRFRGSRATVKTRLEVYLPFVEPFKTLAASPRALDLGCGRGEWLELLQESGFRAQGVDLDEGMLLACRELALDVMQDDALAYLTSLNANSFSVVSAFHVVEHVAFDVLRSLVDEVLRVLKPGGLLIMETPNSENLVVGTSSFYLDPTHQRPIPAKLLSFVAEHAGFARIKTLYLQEAPDILAADNTSLLSVLDGVSQDCAVIAQKQAPSKTSALFDAPFEQSYGTSLIVMASLYDEQAANLNDANEYRVENICQRVNHIETEVMSEQLQLQKNLSEQLQAHHTQSLALGERFLLREQELSTQIEAMQQDSLINAEQLKQAQIKIDELNRSSHHWWLQAEGLGRQLQAISTSTSWRIAMGLRKTKQAVTWLVLLPLRALLWLARLPKRVAKRLLKSAIRFVCARPNLKAGALAVLNKIPRLKSRLHHFAIRAGLVAEAILPAVDPSKDLQLSPRAARIYRELNSAISEREKN